MDSIGDRGGLGRTALEAALKRHAETIARYLAVETLPHPLRQPRPVNACVVTQAEYER